MSSYSIITAPTVEPLSVAEVANYLRVDLSALDGPAATAETALISSMIAAARWKIEDITWRPLCTQVWALNLDFADVKQFIGISKVPVQSLGSIKYFDGDGIEQTITTGVDCQVDFLGDPARIKFSTVPPCKDQMNAMKIIFTCGYGVASSVPEAIKQAMKMLIAHWYEHRELIGVKTAPIPFAVDMILQEFKLTWFYPFNE